VSSKQCIGCKEFKQNNAFYKATTTEDGLNKYCKNCCKVNRALESVRRRDRKSKISFRQRHRAGVLGISCDHTITLAKLFRRDRGTCQICFEWVKPRYASIDHTVPVSKGGHHVWSNVQLVHLKCNLRKGNRE
jgi:hypothetical protein